MPLDVIVNEDLKKMAVALHDRQHYLDVKGADTLLASLTNSLKSGARKLTVTLQDTDYTVKAEEATELLARVTKQLDVLVEMAGRPEPPVDVKMKMDALTLENEELKKRLEQWEKDHPVVKADEKKPTAPPPQNQGWRK